MQELSFSSCGGREALAGDWLLATVQAERDDPWKLLEQYISRGEVRELGTRGKCGPRRDTEGEREYTERYGAPFKIGLGAFCADVC